MCQRLMPQWRELRRASAAVTLDGGRGQRRSKGTLLTTAVASRRVWGVATASGVHTACVGKR